ncbi:LysR substrate-binding domain-containing protein [Flexivirga alba]|uniref:LysR substrate-binding domain-containing protein n=1 Tax=Flexivirga alba TaxID=702742 RepID=A0ABW2AC43_9MICO
MVTGRLLDGRLKLRHLVIVTTIAEHGSVVRAADALHVTQPVVTRALHELESILGVQLFDRHARGVIPTRYGTSFIGHAQAVIAQLRDAEQQVALMASGELGTVTVGTHLAGSNVLLPRAIAGLKRAHPSVTVVVREATPDALQADLLSGDVDLTIGRLTGAVPPRLHRMQLYVEPIRLAARKEHPVHQLRAPRLADLVDRAWILPVEQTMLRTELEDMFAHEGVALPADRIECTSMLTLQHLLESTDVIAALPMLIATANEHLALIDTTLPAIGRAVGVTVAADRTLPPAGERLLENLRSVAKELRENIPSADQPGTRR